jgi:hypothetical protein
VTEAVHIPRVVLVVELEADPAIIVDCATEADREALRTWVRTCRPDLDEMLNSVSAEIAAKRAA